MTGIAKIESRDLNVGDIYKDFYVVPNFQREYVWAQEQADKLLNDIYDEFYDDEGGVIQGPEYFIGSIVVCQDGDGPYQLIDGQQRVTTLYLLFCAIRDCLGEAGVTTPDVLKGQIYSASQDPSTGDDVYRYRVELQYDDSEDALVNIADAEVPVADIGETTRSIRNLVAVYRTIREFLSVKLQNDPAEVKAFAAQVSGRVQLIRIVTPSLSNALKVFETINDRGVGLTAVDLLKNRLFMETPDAKYGQLKERWKVLVDTLDGCKEKPLRFLRYFAMANYEDDWSKGLREDDVYDWFVDHAGACGIESKPLVFVEELVACAEAYANFVQGKDCQGNPSPHIRNITAISGWARTPFMLLLAGRHLAADVFAELCRRTEQLFFCYVITRASSGEYDRNFAKWATDLRAVTTADELDAFCGKWFHPEMHERSQSFDFEIGQLSTSRIQQYRMRYILAKLTQFVEQGAYGEGATPLLDQYLDKKVEIEHILPRTPGPGVSFDRPMEYDEYAGRLGNLTLLEKPINASLKNAPYDQKKPGYGQSKFLLTKSLDQVPAVGKATQIDKAVADLQSFDEWTSEAIEQRQQMLAGLARKVWGMPEAAPTQDDAQAEES